MFVRESGAAILRTSERLRPALRRVVEQTGVVEDQEEFLVLLAIAGPPQGIDTREAGERLAGIAHGVADQRHVEG